MRDLLQQLQLIHREVGRRTAPSGELVSVVMRRTYDHPVAELWSALTDRERLARWMYPISGELRAGGTFQFEGNAGGDILACEPPDHLRVTFGGPASIVDLRLVRRGEHTELVLEHTVPIEIAQSVAGALWVGPGWDLGFLSLALHLLGELGDAKAYRESDEALGFADGSIDAWSAAIAASGGTAAEIAGAAAAARAHFTPGRG